MHRRGFAFIFYLYLLCVSACGTPATEPTAAEGATQMPLVTSGVNLLGPDLAITDLSFSVTEKHSSDSARIALLVSVTNQGNASIVGSNIRVSVSEKILAQPLAVYYEISSTSLDGVSIPPRSTMTVTLDRDFSGYCGGGGFPGLGYVLGYEAQAHYAKYPSLPPGQEDINLSNNYKEFGYEAICDKLALVQASNSRQR